VDEEVEQQTTTESVAGRVTLHMHDGSNQAYFVTSPKGCPQNPMTAEEVAERFLALSAQILGETECNTWLKEAFRIESLKDLHPLFALRK
jgi:2-methylcitrate dehydratase PrpD